MPRSLKRGVNLNRGKTCRNVERLYLLHPCEMICLKRFRGSLKKVVLITFSLNQQVSQSPFRSPKPYEDENGVSLSHVSRLDTILVVDANSFLNDYNEAESLQSRGVGEEDKPSGLAYRSN